MQPLLVTLTTDNCIHSTSDHQLQRALSILTEGRTTLIIAHRLSKAVMDADMIFL